MLSQNEKAIVRLLIERNPNSDYMVQLGASDDFARSEIQAKSESLIERLNSIKASHQNHIASLTSEIEKIDASLLLFQDE